MQKFVDIPTIRIIHEIPQKTGNRGALILGLVVIFGLTKQVNRLEKKISKLDARLTALEPKTEEKEAAEMLDKDILEEDFLK